MPPSADSFQLYLWHKGARVGWQANPTPDGMRIGMTLADLCDGYLRTWNLGGERMRFTVRWLPLMKEEWRRE